MLPAASIDCVPSSLMDSDASADVAKSPTHLLRQLNLRANAARRLATEQGVRREPLRMARRLVGQG